MLSSCLLRRALAGATAAVFCAGGAAALLGAGGPAPVEVALARAAVVRAADATPVPAEVDDATAVPLAAPAVPASPTTTTTTTTTTAPPAPPAPPAPAAPAPAPVPARPAEPVAAAPAPAPVSAPAPTRAPQSSFARVSSCETNMMRWMNEVRASHGLRPLTFDPGIQWVSVAWSDSMAARQRLQHNPDFGAQIFAERPQAMSASENVGRTTGSDRSIFDGFMESPPHRGEILSTTSTHATTGCVHDGNQLWVTVNFWG